MRFWDSFTQGESGRSGSALFAIGLLGIVLALPPVAEPVTEAYADFLQRVQGQAAGPDVVMVDTSPIAAVGQPVWTSNQYPDLLRRLRTLNARLVVESEPRQTDAAQPSIAQLAALADAEARNRAAGGAAVGEGFAAELAELRRRAELDRRVNSEMTGLRNAILAVPVFDDARAPTVASTCTKHILATAHPDNGIRARRVRAAGSLPMTSCQTALGAGHVEFWPDADGVVRRVHLFVDSAGKLVPSAALRAVMAVTNPAGAVIQLAPDSIDWGDHKVAMSPDATLQLRYYAAADEPGGLHSIDAGQLLQNDATAAKAVSGRIVVLGRTTAVAGESDYRTPTADAVTTPLLLGTAIANLVADQYILRPVWLGWAEGMLFITLGGLLLAWGGRIPPAIGLMTGICLALILLAAEAYFFIGEGLAAKFSNIAVFMLAGWALAPMLRGQRVRRESAVGLAVAAKAKARAPIAGNAAENAPTREPAPDLSEEFSRLRHRQPSDEVKERLYEIALEHARLHDLAMAEKVLRHLASLDPDFRNAGEKLRKLTGLRETPVGSPARQADPPMLQQNANPADLSGQTIGRYRIEQPIGRGAMATVYLGRDPKINRRVAIKTIALAAEFAESDLVNARTQFLREAESAGRLNHPNIISIYDAGEDGTVAYLAMEYFQGKALSQYVQQGSLLPAKTVLELMARAAEALHYAHGQHVVHRDIKPANLMYDRSSDSLKIADFGIARLTDTSKTKTGIILGTPSFMSPEQLAGGNITGQSDLFSLGITLYQLLTGLAPFRADSIPKLMQKIAHERHESVRLVRDDLPRSVDALFDQALAKDPADRFPSGRSMATALRECGNSLGTAAAS